MKNLDAIKVADTKQAPRAKKIETTNHYSKKSGIIQMVKWYINEKPINYGIY